VTFPRSKSSQAPAGKDFIRLRAFAKINLGLKVLGKRPDGYHEIRTVYQTLTLHDRLEIRLRSSDDGVAVDCDDPLVPSGEGNLVYRACEVWRQARGFRAGIHVRLEKRIPAGAGLGGASTDTAATILGLEHLTGNQMPLAACLELGARLGSDVPLFFLGGRVLGCGRGEQVGPLEDLPPQSCLVIFPGFSISTAEAYQNLDLKLTKEGRDPSIVTLGAWPQFSSKDRGPAENDFEQVVFTRWPELARFKAQLIRAGAETASLTGSGSALYAFFASAPELAHASKLAPRGWRVFRTRTLARKQYKRLVFID
jgi:4-diphosphocytidyl-2-C-methyl-D-erythritol kinase